MADPYKVVSVSKLKLKGKTKSKEVVALKKKKKHVSPVDEELTDAQLRHHRRRAEKEKEEIKQAVKTSHREKIEDLNNKLANLTEHNDIPRISAAGNGNDGDMTSRDSFVDKDVAACGDLRVR
eukprot:CAMPEP_0197424104 /NCGR_PEP_ID=MMETSP1170-20131217/24686_1 /TAXON_ID=54406 /ORGANISM="Sarcinochrysis sp, Strain CCMP770" /LENGTH=122 /DNA_ID=CAMNT_0042951577 /DNA_START=14 /DNA_END=380 /DNA_ORIENTATION=+